MSTADNGCDGSCLEVLHLAKSYGSRKVVKDVSLSVRKGEVVGLLGPNGAGKTTSFYMIVGLVRSDGGDIRIDGQSVANMPIHRRSRLGLSYLPQEASIFRKLSVQDNVRAVLELQTDERGQPLPRAVIEERLTALLEELRVQHLRESPALALSGGERRRVEIARALATQPRFILLDEPFAGIDPIAVIEIQRIIGFLKERGIGVLITDHNVRETLGICDHAFIISDGEVLARGTPDSWRRRAALRVLAGRTGEGTYGPWALQEYRRGEPHTVIEAGAALGRYSSHEWIHEIDVPTAVVVTELDQIVPPHRQRKLADAIPGATVHPVQGDHVCCVQGADRFAPVLVDACADVAARLPRP